MFQFWSIIFWKSFFQFFLLERHYWGIPQKCSSAQFILKWEGASRFEFSMTRSIEFRRSVHGKSARFKEFRMILQKPQFSCHRPGPTENWYTRCGYKLLGLRSGQWKSGAIYILSIQACRAKLTEKTRRTASVYVNQGVLHSVLCDVILYHIAIEMHCEQCTAIKFCLKLEMNHAGTYKMMKTAYGDACLTRWNIFEWFGRFWEDRESVKDEAVADIPTPTKLVMQFNRLIEIID